MRVRLAVWVIAGVLAGAVAAGLLVATGALDRAPEAGVTATTATTGDQGPDDAGDEAATAAADFVAAWRRSRLGTYVAHSTFRRTVAAGGGFTGETSVAQRPPDRLERTFGSITARLGDRVVLCRTAAGVYRCDSGPTRHSYRSVVRGEVALLRGYVEGPAPLYTVAADGDCFDLTQVRPLPAPPYGTAARFCFDPDTGAITYLRVARDEATDVTEATSVSADVRGADLQPPADGDSSQARGPDRDGG